MPTGRCELVGVIGTVTFTLIATTLFLISLVTPYWVEGRALRSEVKIGLWRICREDWTLAYNSSTNHTDCINVFSQSFGRVLFTGPGMLNYSMLKHSLTVTVIYIVTRHKTILHK